jgi:hypothetical protein
MHETPYRESLFTAEDTEEQRNRGGWTVWYPRDAPFHVFPASKIFLCEKKYIVNKK